MIMRSNKELTPQEFEVSINIKRALNAMAENPLETKGFLYAALKALHA